MSFAITAEQAKKRRRPQPLSEQQLDQRFDNCTVANLAAAVKQR